MAVLVEAHPSGTDTSPTGPDRLTLLLDVAGQPSTLDGAWWPRSQDLSVEVPELAAELENRCQIRFTRLIYNPATWLPAPHKLWPAGRRVNLGWFTEIDPHLITLTTTTGRRLELLVIPPDTDPAVAALALTSASSPHNDRHASAVLDAAVERSAA
jgi:hypothetical protein